MVSKYQFRDNLHDLLMLLALNFFYWNYHSSIPTHRNNNLWKCQEVKEIPLVKKSARLLLSVDILNQWTRRGLGAGNKSFLKKATTIWTNGQIKALHNVQHILLNILTNSKHRVALMMKLEPLSLQISSYHNLAGLMKDAVLIVWKGEST